MTAARASSLHIPESTPCTDKEQLAENVKSVAHELSEKEKIIHISGKDPGFTIGHRPIT